MSHLTNRDVAENLLGRTVVNVNLDEEPYYDGQPVINSILLDNGLTVEFWGRADRAMISEISVCE